MDAETEKRKPGIAPLFKRYKGELLFGILVVYVLLLALGTIGVLFDIEWILNFPIF